MFQQWNLAGASAVSLTVAAQNYLDYQNRVLKSFPPYYMIMSLLPCDMLWEWLGKELHPYAGPNNLYSFWITENDTGSQTWEDFVDAHASRWVLATVRCIQSVQVTQLQLSLLGLITLWLRKYFSRE